MTAVTPTCSASSTRPLLRAERRASPRWWRRARSRQSAGDALDGAGAADLVVDIDQHGAKLEVAFGELVGDGAVGDELLHRVFRIDADHRRVGTGHADVGDVCGAARQ